MANLGELLNYRICSVGEHLFVYQMLNMGELLLCLIALLLTEPPTILILRRLQDHLLTVLLLLSELDKLLSVMYCFVPSVYCPLVKIPRIRLRITHFFASFVTLMFP